ncbi:hypothetical protein Tco_0890329 [Tanacetum coccineum]|uniref:Uncharacterized protein n=1 Tax=Tanacetum coccineum TaxID=301880 RepID=A0ABQ5C217_9ASTR
MDKLLELGRVNWVIHDTRAIVRPCIQKAGLAGLTKRVVVAGVGSPAVGLDKEMEQKPHIRLEFGLIMDSAVVSLSLGWYNVRYSRCRTPNPS